jgi:hypothetical protein
MRWPARGGSGGRSAQPDPYAGPPGLHQVGRLEQALKNPVGRRRVAGATGLIGLTPAGSLTGNSLLIIGPG